MKVIPTRIHGIIDYLFVPVVLLLPRLFGWGRGATRLLTGAGIAALIYSLFTRYEMGLFKLIPMKGHLALDAASAALLCAAPLLLEDVESDANSGLLGVGLFEIAVIALSQTEPETIYFSGPAHFPIPLAEDGEPLPQSEGELEAAGL